VAEAFESRFPTSDDDIATPGGVTLRRWFVDERSVLLTVGDFGAFMEAWRAHARLWEGGFDGLSETLVRQGLAAATLYLANRPRDEVVAWTLNLKEPPTNLFLTGEARRGIVTGRVFVEGVRTSESSRLYVQTLRARGEPTVSAIEVDGFDVLEIFEQYYARSEQSPARFFELGRLGEGSGDDFAMILGMPGADRGWVESLDALAIPALVAEARLLEVRPMRFECGCNPRKMLKALRAIFGKKPDELFQGDTSVETTCPRCGRRWMVSREQFEDKELEG
jgi:molecular chaperone Hsp33